MKLLIYYVLHTLQRLCLCKRTHPIPKRQFLSLFSHLTETIYVSFISWCFCFIQFHFQQRSFIVSRIIDSSVNIQWILLWPHEITFFFTPFFVSSLLKTLTMNKNAGIKKKKHPFRQPYDRQLTIFMSLNMVRYNIVVNRFGENTTHMSQKIKTIQIKKQIRRKRFK